MSLATNTMQSGLWQQVTWSLIRTDHVQCLQHAVKCI